MMPPEWKAAVIVAKVPFLPFLIIHECIIADITPKCNSFY